MRFRFWQIGSYTRGVCRTFSNIFDGAFYGKKFKVIFIAQKKFCTTFAPMQTFNRIPNTSVPCYLQVMFLKFRSNGMRELILKFILSANTRVTSFHISKIYFVTQYRIPKNIFTRETYFSKATLRNVEPCR